MGLKKILINVFCVILFLMSKQLVYAQKIVSDKKPIGKTNNTTKYKIVENATDVKSKKVVKDSKKSSAKTDFKKSSNKAITETKKAEKNKVTAKKLPKEKEESKTANKEKISSKNKVSKKANQKENKEHSANLLESDDVNDTILDKSKNGKILTGVASFYSAKFDGRKTANGEIFSNKKFTAACNRLPLGTWLKITNLSNNKTVIVKTNDRLHPKMTRLVDLTYAAAQKLDFVNKGLTKVKAEVIKHK